jgi:Ca2+-transporting ATPase
MLSPKCVVLRDGGSRASLESKDLVPGDVIFLQPGDCVPADARLLECTGLATLESMLTGESLPVSKNAAEVFPDVTPLGDRKNCVFAGTLVMRGQGTAVVVATGNGTQLGQINSLVNDEEDEDTHLQEQLATFGRFIGAITLVVGVASFLLARFRFACFPLSLFAQNPSSLELFVFFMWF